MLGALGGLTAVIALLNVRGFKPYTLLFWALFAGFAWLHTHGGI